MKKEELIKSLIKDTLVHNKLLMGLNETGLEAWKYDLHLSETILKIAEINLNDAELKNYFSLFDTLTVIDVQNHEQLEKGCEKIYIHLLKLKQQGK